jgi:hypothetical protein
VKAKEEKQKVELAKVQPQDDPILVGLRKDYTGVLLHENDTWPYITYKVVNVEWTKPHYNASCVEVQLGKDGQWIVPDESREMIDGELTDEYKWNKLVAIVLQDESSW